MEEMEQRYLALYAECAGEVLQYVRSRIPDRELAEDIVQEVFFVAWKKRAEFTGSGNPAGWLIETAKYKILEEFRRVRERSWVPLEECAESFCSGESGYEMAEWIHILKEFLDLFEFQIFQDYFFYGKSMREIAGSRGITEGNLRIRLHRMKKRLRGKI